MDRYSDEQPESGSPDLYIRCCSFPPWVWELRGKSYPNLLLAASPDIEALRAVAKLHEMTKHDPPPVWTWVTA